MRTVLDVVTLVFVVGVAISILLLIVQWRRLRWRLPYLLHGLAYSDEWRRLNAVIRRAESEAGVQLTWGARQMLTIPVIEVLERRGDVLWDEVDRSIQTLVATIARETPPEELEVFGGGGSVSVIRAFARRFCSIPPFCSRRDEVRQ